MAQLWSSGKLGEEGGATSMSKLVDAENAKLFGKFGEGKSFAQTIWKI